MGEVEPDELNEAERSERDRDARIRAAMAEARAKLETTKETKR